MRKHRPLALIKTNVAEPVPARPLQSAFQSYARTAVVCGSIPGALPLVGRFLRLGGGKQAFALSLFARQLAERV